MKFDFEKQNADAKARRKAVVELRKTMSALEIAKKLEVSRQRVYQMLNKAKKDEEC